MSKNYEKKRKENSKLKTAVASLRHTPEYKSLGGLSDSVVCSCGWQSNGYWDYAEAAWAEWYQHAKNILAESQTLFDF